MAGIFVGSRDFTTPDSTIRNWRHIIFDTMALSWGLPVILLHDVADEPYYRVWDFLCHFYIKFRELEEELKTSDVPSSKTSLVKNVPKDKFEAWLSAIPKSKLESWMALVNEKRAQKQVTTQPQSMQLSPSTSSTFDKPSTSKPVELLKRPTRETPTLNSQQLQSKAYGLQKKRTPWEERTIKIEKALVPDELAEHVAEDPPVEPVNEAQTAKSEQPKRNFKDVDLGGPKPLRDMPDHVLPFFSASDIDFRVSYEMTDVITLHQNCPHFQLGTRYCQSINRYSELFDSDKPFLFHRVGAWDHLKDVPRLTETNLERLKLSDAKKFYQWLIEQNDRLTQQKMILNSRVKVERQRYQRILSYQYGEKAPKQSHVKLAKQQIDNELIATPLDAFVRTKVAEIKASQPFWMNEDLFERIRNKNRMQQRLRTAERRKGKRPATIGLQQQRDEFKAYRNTLKQDIDDAKVARAVYEKDCLEKYGVDVNDILNEVISAAHEKLNRKAAGRSRKRKGGDASGKPKVKLWKAAHTK